MKILKRMMCLILLGLLVALPQMNQAASMPQIEMNAPQGDIITVSIKGHQFSVEVPHAVSLFPLTVKISTQDGTVLYNTTRAVGNIFIPTSKGENGVIGDGIQHRVTSESVEHGIIGDTIEHLIIGDGIQHLTLTVTQGNNTIMTENIEL